MSIGDESIFLRLQQLRNGLLQFTDTTNAYRMFAEHGKDIKNLSGNKSRMNRYDLPPDNDGAGKMQ